MNIILSTIISHNCGLKQFIVPPKRGKIHNLGTLNIQVKDPLSYQADKYQIIFPCIQFVYYIP